MRILGIETSCDETSVAIVEDGVHVLSNVIATSKKSFENLAGVIPEEAARRQVECMVPVLEESLKIAGSQLRDIDALAVTKGPGLLGSLLVGTTTAKIVAKTWNKPLIGVHHTLGHLSSPWLENDEPHFPILTLSASGGHTDLWHRTSHLTGILLGRTRDDAAGEAFDKGASLLGLPYPGGPAVAKLAESGNPLAFPFSLPLHGEKTLDFSFSGLKTALKYLLRDEQPTSEQCSHVAASYQHAICAHLTDRIMLALEQHPSVREVHLVGGVSANVYLRAFLAHQWSMVHCPLPVRWPSALAYCTDNAAMIAAAGYFLMQETGDAATQPFETVASLSLRGTLSSAFSGA